MTLTSKLSTSSTSSITGMLDGCNRPSANEVVLLINTTGTTYVVRRYTTAAGHAQQGSDITLTNTAGSAVPKHITMIASDKAIVSGTGGSPSTHWLVNITSSAVTELSAESARNGRPHILIGNRNGIAFSLSNSTGKVIKYDSGAATATASTFFAVLGGSENLTSVCVNTDNNNFIFGTDHGRLFEIDASTNAVKKEFTLPEMKGLFVDNDSANTSLQISGMVYTYGFLAVQTNYSRQIVLDYRTLNVVNEIITGDTSSSNLNGSTTFSFSEADGPYAVIFNSQSSLQLPSGLSLIDFCKANCPELGKYGNYYSNTQLQYLAAGVQGSVVWLIETGKFHWITATGRRTVATNTVTISISGATDGEVFVIDDTAGELMIRCPISSSGTRDVPLTTGKSLLVVVKHGYGVNTKFQVSRIST
jgi:hypothetical protein